MLLTLRRTSPGDIDSFKPRFAFPHERLEKYSACHQHLASTQTMRLPSHGGVSLIILTKRGPFHHPALPQARWVRDWETIQENTTVSPGVS